MYLSAGGESGTSLDQRHVYNQYNVSELTGLQHKAMQQCMWSVLGS